MRWLLAAVGGAVVAYFMDPDRGRRRRNMARDRLRAMLRRQSLGISKMGRRAAGSAYGVAQEMVHAPDIREALDDATLARKVESAIVRDPNIPKGSINVNVEDGVVVLRGEIERSAVILEIEAAVRRIPDVLDVQNLLHRPGELAPNKVEAMSAGRPPGKARARSAKHSSGGGEGTFPEMPPAKENPAA